ncbi:hypothetical protein HN51_070459 [Arachis hypogaea]|nr:uncharacterized protein DS421_15g510530 [Arachis hypogaea]
MPMCEGSSTHPQDDPPPTATATTTVVEGSVLGENNLKLLEDSPDIIGLTTLTQKSEQPPPPLNNVELMATLKALTAAVEVLTSKVEAFEGRLQEHDRVVQLLCSPAQRNEQTMLEYLTEIETYHVEVAGASKKARTQKHAVGDQNTNVFICIPDDDDTKTNHPNVARYCAPPWKGQKTTNQVNFTAKGKCDVAQGTMHTPLRVK